MARVRQRIPTQMRQPALGATARFAENAAARNGNQFRATSIMAFPRKGDSYSDCFYPPVEGLGVKVCGGEFSGRWLLKHLRNIDYVHIHWPSFFYNKPQRSKCIRDFALFS